MDSSPENFTATHIIYITPHGGLFMTPAEGFDLTSLVTSEYGTKEFRSEVDKAIKSTIKSANRPQPIFTSTKESRFAMTSIISTPTNPNLASVHTSLVTTHPSNVKFTDKSFHPDLSIRQAAYSFSRTMSFVFNSREYSWKWGMWSLSKLVVGGDDENTAARFYLKRGGLRFGGVMAVDENKIDLSVAFATILVCLKRERERRV